MCSYCGGPSLSLPLDMLNPGKYMHGYISNSAVVVTTSSEYFRERRTEGTFSGSFLLYIEDFTRLLTADTLL